ncbi:unnamed protein product [Euphydryas editha]|uniref:Uncharacterized protein n=1 Tax=Euphydryas editha TaxID=104508 RepID=A0AAU9U0M5_EUPED|nr:unnamed protein product [Euphydryas editha]
MAQNKALDLRKNACGTHLFPVPTAVSFAVLETRACPLTASHYYIHYTFQRSVLHTRCVSSQSQHSYGAPANECSGVLFKSRRPRIGGCASRFASLAHSWFA